MSINLAKALSDAAGRLPWRPELFRLSRAEDRQRLEDLFAQGAVRHVCDDFDEQLREYHAFLNPTLIFSPDLERTYQAYRSGLEAAAPLWQQGAWAFYPWRCALVHVLEEDEYRRVRTSRNRDLISLDEQRLFASAVIGIAGLSVGNSVALAVILEGGADRIRLADFDRFSLSNINRVRASAADFGSNKAEMTARQIFEINPYARVEVFDQGLTEGNIDAFLGGLSAVVDEIDNIAVKCLIRERAKRMRIPVLMATDNGDSAIIDIERYDLDPGTAPFHGRMGDVSYEKLLRLDKMGIGRLAVKYVGPEITPPRLRASMLRIGKTIVSWPQLGGAALMNGSITAYCLRAISAGLPLNAGRAVFDLDANLVPGYRSPLNKEKRDREAVEFAKSFGL
jgi:hypothetical protein